MELEEMVVMLVDMEVEEVVADMEVVEDMDHLHNIIQAQIILLEAVVVEVMVAMEDLAADGEAVEVVDLVVMEDMEQEVVVVEAVMDLEQMAVMGLYVEVVEVDILQEEEIMEEAVDHMVLEVIWVKMVILVAVEDIVPLEVAMVFVSSNIMLNFNPITTK